ncbi:hypothetical protein ID866_2972 [Astraeus odoratus]|nr:hypothetical protein ID866_2972 [Astraeus odoratus]
MDSPWDEDPHYAPEASWQKIATEFTNSGYREGIVAGKEAALQEGFDVGFANIGVPVGRDLGSLRGAASALVSFLSSCAQEPHNSTSTELEEARAISATLSQIRFADIAPPDVEAEQHAREHLNDDPGLAQTEELSRKRDMENLEDMLSRLSAGPREPMHPARPTSVDITRLKDRLALLAGRLDLGFCVRPHHT